MKKKLLITLSLALVMALPCAAKKMTGDLKLAPARAEVPLIKNVFPTELKELQVVPNSNIKLKSISKVNAKGQPEVSYARPAGTFFGGLTPNISGTLYPYLIAPAYQNVDWKNLTTDSGVTYEWTYPTGDYDTSGSVLMSTKSDKDIKTFLPFGDFPLPMLKGTINNVDSIFQLGAPWNVTDQYGDKVYSIICSGGSIGSFLAPSTLYATNIYPTAPMIGVDAGQNGLNVSAAATSWTKRLAEDYSITATNVSVSGIGEVYEKPEHPYVLSSVLTILANLVEGATIGDMQLDIYEVVLDENHEIIETKDKICTAKCAAADIITNYTYYKSVTFNNLVYTDPVTELESDLVIDSAILVVVTPKDKTNQLAKVLYGGDKITGAYNTAYSIVNFTTDGSNYSMPLPAGMVYGDSNNNKYYVYSNLIQLDITYNWLHSEDRTFDAPMDGGSKTFIIDSAYPASAWNITLEDGSPLPLWLTTKTEDGSFSQDGVTYYTYQTKLTVTADGIMAGFPGRNTKIKVSYPGADIVIDVNQGTSGINGVQSNSAAKVKVMNGDFVVTAPSNITEVSVYNVAGQLVKSDSLSGVTYIDGKNLEKGLYILKFNDGSSVKAVK